MAEIVKNLSEDTISLPSVSAPTSTTGKLYNEGGSLTWNGTDISAGGGIAAVVDDITPQLGGDLDVNGQSITAINGAGNGIVITTSAAAPSGSSGNVTVATANSNALVNSIIAGQDETDYTFDFNGGTGHAVSDVITMTDGSTVTVDSLSGSAVLTFTVTTSGGVDVPIAPHPQQLLQSSTTGSGTGFLLEPQGNNVVQDAQTGGNLTLSAGDGGTSTTGGGDVNITSGRQRGTVLIETGDARTTGNGAYAGKIDIRVGTSWNNSGENVNIFGGNADYEGGDAFGGDVRIVAGNGFATIGTPDNSYGGAVRIEGGRALYGGSGALPYEGGNVQIDGGQSEFYGGDVVITSGDTTGADGIAGNIILQTPDGGYGASIRVYGGDASFASAAGADIRIKAGNSTSGHGGDVEFTFGTAPGDAGAMVINTSLAPSVTTNKLYNVAGALTWNGTDLTAGGGGISNVVEDTTPQLGGNLDLNAFDIVTTNAVSPSAIDIIAGDATGSNNGGYINITAGASSTGDGGQINITAGDGTSGGFPGNVTVEAGGAGSYSGGATAYIRGGAGVGVFAGGEAHIVGGTGGTTGRGGDVEILPGNGGSTSGNGGDILLNPGNSNAGSAGAILIATQTAPSPTANKLYNVAGTLFWNAIDLTASGIAAVVDDTTPQLGGMLDVNGNAIGDGTLELITFTEIGSAVNQINITNAITATAPIIGAAGGDANIDISVQPKGTGNVALGNFTLDGDQTVGAGQDNFVMTYDNAAGVIALEAAVGGAATDLATSGADVAVDAAAPPTTGQILTATSATNATWQTIPAGSGGLAVVSVTTTTATAAAAQATMVDDDTAGSTVTITLPAGSANDQQVIKKLGTTANVIIDGDTAETLDGAATFTLTAQYASLTVIWNGTEWSII